MFKLGTKFIPIVIILLIVGVGVVWFTWNDGPEEAPQQVENTESRVEKISTDNPPILKSLGINIDTWDRQTNLAGDLIFDRRVIYDDGRVAGDKVFLDFGHKDKYRIDSPGSLEYWFYLPLGTKVRAPLEGIVEIAFFEHTQDWGVSIKPFDSNWIVSFEHLVNVSIQAGDKVRVGDVVGEAAPRINNAIAMVELAVWTGGQNIIKYCPFTFLDKSLKPVYEEKLTRLAKEWEEFAGKDVYKQENWVAPGCLIDKIIEN